MQSSKYLQLYVRYFIKLQCLCVCLFDIVVFCDCIIVIFGHFKLFYHPCHAFLIKLYLIYFLLDIQNTERVLRVFRFLLCTEHKVNYTGDHIM
jgi:hypothetical protein